MQNLSTNERKRYNRSPHLRSMSNTSPWIHTENIHKAPTAQKFKTPRHETKITTTEVSTWNDQ